MVIPIMASRIINARHVHASLCSARSNTSSRMINVVSLNACWWNGSHSTQFSGKEDHRSSKASRREDLQVEEPVACWDCSAFHFHSTLAGMLSASLVGHEVIQM